MKPLRLEHDPAADAVYVYLSAKPYAYGEDIDHERRIDYAMDGSPIGVEFTCVSEGVDLSHIPQVESIAVALRGIGIREVAPPK